MPERGSKEPRCCGAAEQKKDLATFHVLIECPTLRLAAGPYGVGRRQELQLSTVPALPPGCGGYLIEGKTDCRGQPTQSVRMGNATSLITMDGLACGPAVNAFVLGGRVHPSGDTIQRKAPSLPSLRDEFCERKVFH
jgi:hypothetical protein